MPRSAVTALAAPTLPAASAVIDKSTDAAQQRVLPDAMTNGNAHDSSHDADSSDAEEAVTAGNTPPQPAEGRGAQAAAATATAAAVGGEVQAGEDVFDETELDPAKCRAIESSLWELESLRHHYYHTVRFLGYIQEGGAIAVHKGVTSCVYCVLSNVVQPALLCNAQHLHKWCVGARAVLRVTPGLDKAFDVQGLASTRVLLLTSIGCSTGYDLLPLQLLPDCTNSCNNFDA